MGKLCRSHKTTYSCVVLVCATPTGSSGWSAIPATTPVSCATRSVRSKSSPTSKSSSLSPSSSSSSSNAFSASWQLPTRPIGARSTKTRHIIWNCHSGLSSLSSCRLSSPGSSCSRTWYQSRCLSPLKWSSLPSPCSSDGISTYTTPRGTCRPVCNHRI